jgi:YVTN family beta-propeller protein
MNPEGTKLCVAGTMSDYAAIVDRASFANTIAAHGERPYWATNSADGRYCFVSFSGDDAVSAISYETEQEVARIPLGDHPSGCGPASSRPVCSGARSRGGARPPPGLFGYSSSALGLQMSPGLKTCGFAGSPLPDTSIPYDCTWKLTCPSSGS